MSKKHYIFGGNQEFITDETVFTYATVAGVSEIGRRMLNAQIADVHGLPVNHPMRHGGPNTDGLLLDSPEWTETAGNSADGRVTYSLRRYATRAPMRVVARHTNGHEWRDADTRSYRRRARGGRK